MRAKREGEDGDASERADANPGRERRTVGRREARARRRAGGDRDVKKSRGSCSVLDGERWVEQRRDDGIERSRA